MLDNWREKIKNENNQSKENHQWDHFKYCDSTLFVGEKPSAKGELIGPMPDIIEDDGQQVKLEYVHSFVLCILVDLTSG